MKKRRYTHQPIAQAVRQAEQGTAVAELRRREGIHPPSRLLTQPQAPENNGGLSSSMSDLTRGGRDASPH